MTSRAGRAVIGRQARHPEGEWLEPRTDATGMAQKRKPGHMALQLRMSTPI